MCYDVLNLLEYSASYEKYLEFIKEDEQKGRLLSFSRVKEVLSPPFLMVFEDIIADKKDLADMLNIGRKYIAGDTTSYGVTCGCESDLYYSYEFVDP